MDKTTAKLQRLREIISLIPGNVYWKDSNGRFLGCNNNVANILKLASPDDIIGKSNEELFSKALATQANEIDRKVIEGNAEIVAEETGLNIHGEEAVYLTRKIPLHDENGHPNGILGISVDITERKHFEKELQTAKEKAEVANEAKTEFIENMSHDMRTPFNGILSLTEYMAQKETDPAKKELLGCVVGSAKQLLNLLNEVLDLCNIETGNLLAQKILFDLPELIHSLQELFRAELDSKRLEFKVIYLNDIPKQLFGDRLRLHRIILNLIGNAVKFTEQGSITIQIDAEKLSADKINLIIHIIDTGIGMPEDKLNIIFDRFTRLTSSYQGRYPGSGIGLHIVNQFIQELGGNISVTSKLGEGSTFTCIIPFQLNE